MNWYLRRLPTDTEWPMPAALDHYRYRYRWCRYRCWSWYHSSLVLESFDTRE